jgi:WD40 repeat protein
LSPDGKTLASANGPVTLWDVKTGVGRATPPPEEAHSAHTSEADSVAFSPDGKTLASCSMDQTVKLWDVATGREKDTFRGHQVFLYSVAFSPDGNYLASGGGSSPAATDRRIYQGFHDLPTDPEWFREHVELKVWDLATGKERTFARDDRGRITSVAFSPDGKTLAAGVGIFLGQRGWDGTVRVWDVAGGKERVFLRDNEGMVPAVAFSPDGKTLAAVQGRPALGERGSAPDVVKLWDLDSGRVRARLEGHPFARAVAFSPDGTTVATAGDDSYPIPEPKVVTGDVRLWDAATGQSLGAPLTCPHSCISLAFASGGKILAVGGETRRKDGNIILSEITLWELDPPGSTAP